ncbi:hypothetical protein [Butyrivibrio sp.]|uniref:hypothetical protein n=1 Tax=Butyrivibrio sp. TaxID=28121 RepID=UPI0025C01B51|nr:hypothetical protein [Butyrivibrio sp.]MBE5838437.1 hypothetical protein [Butyrivibrio sp.]
MFDEKSMNNSNLDMLKECYELAVLNADNEIAKNVIRQKIKAIEILDSPVAAVEMTSYSKHESQIVTDAIFELSSDSSEISTVSRIVENLPESGEKEYLLALIALRKGTGESNRIEAVRHISLAHSYAPNDPRIIALARILEEAD